MPATRLGIFVSSTQKELAEERRAVKSFIEGDRLLGRFFTVFLFEDLPASDRRADAVYLAEVDRCAVYLGIFGYEYGVEDGEGFSPTEREFERATATGKPRLIFVKGTDDQGRHPKMRSLIRRAGRQLIRRRFGSHPELTAALYASLVDYLEACGTIQTRPFEDRPCQEATIDDVDARAVTSFVRLARIERQFPLPVKTPTADVLAHLHLLHGDGPGNAAILLFGLDPQRFHPSAEVRCMHFHGTEIQRPVPFYRVFKGTLFEQVDMAVDFVLSKLNRSVGTRAESNRAPVRHEIPPDVIREAIVNAIAHRDYTTAAAVQVSVFADRVEVWNPGALLPPLTLESLRQPHGSIARNPRICEALFLGHYIEKYGTGTLMMIRECLAHALPEPDFAQRGGEFTIAVWRDWLTEEVLAGFRLNERQLQAVSLVKTRGQLTNREFRDQTGVIIRTATRDLDALVRKGVLMKVGTTGRSTYYVLARKLDTNRTNRT
jgi:predicted HTH transcriptional regulator